MTGNGGMHSASDRLELIFGRGYDLAEACSIDLVVVGGEAYYAS